MSDEEFLKDQVYELTKRLREVEESLFGARGHGGLIADLDKHDDLLRRLNAVVFQDSTGKKGLAHDIDVLMGRREAKDKLSGRRWAFWTLVVGNLVIAAKDVKWHEVIEYFRHPKLDKAGQMIERAKHPKPRRRHYKITQPVATDDTANQEMPKVQ